MEMKRFEGDKGVMEWVKVQRTVTVRKKKVGSRQRDREKESNRTKLHAIRLTDSTTNQNYLLGCVIVMAGSMHILNYTSNWKKVVCIKLVQDWNKKTMHWLLICHASVLRAASTAVMLVKAEFLKSGRKWKGMSLSINTVYFQVAYVISTETSIYDKPISDSFIFLTGRKILFSGKQCSFKWNSPQKY